MELPPGPGRQRQAKTDGGVHRALGDGIALQPAVLGVAPRALGPLEPLRSRGVLEYALLARGRARHPAADKKAADALVVHDAVGDRIVQRGVADVGLVDA